MNKDSKITDEEIRKFFHENRPVPSDPDEFNRKFAARCRATASLREYHASEMSRCRRNYVLILIIGIFLDNVINQLIVLKPQPAMFSSSGMLAVALSLLTEGDKALLILSIAAAGMLYGLRNTLAER